MMNYEMFKEEVLEKVSSLVEDTKEVKINEFVKNNDLILDGLIVRDKEQTCSVSPTIYLNPLFDEYSNGASIEDITDKIMSIYSNAEPPEFTKKAKQFEDYDFVKKHLYFKVVNYEMNKKMLEDVPHFKTLDLAIIFACLLDKDNDATASIPIKNEHLKFWGIDKTQLYEDAFKNATEMLPPKIYSLFKTVVTREFNNELNLNNIQLDDMDLLILTNETKVNGAGTMLYPNLLETIANQLDSNLIIIPSSTHEVLILRKTGDLKLEDLDFLVNTVNHTELSTTEVLSTHVYIYLKDEKELTMPQN